VLNAQHSSVRQRAAAQEARVDDACIFQPGAGSLRHFIRRSSPGNRTRPVVPLHCRVVTKAERETHSGLPRHTHTHGALAYIKTQIAAGLSAAPLLLLPAKWIQFRRGQNKQSTRPSGALRIPGLFAIRLAVRPANAAAAAGTHFNYTSRYGVVLACAAAPGVRDFSNRFSQSWLRRLLRVFGGVSVWWDLWLRVASIWITDYAWDMMCSWLSVTCISLVFEFILCYHEIPLRFYVIVNNKFLVS
jgi:hypothetical protein